MAKVQSKATITVVEDDPALRSLIAEYLQGEGFSVVALESGVDLLRITKQQALDLIILDLQLKNEDGLDLLRELRLKSDVPVIITTGHRKDEIDRVVGLELGADDYLTKPFGLRELLARIRAVLRRHATDYARRKINGFSYHFGGWKLQPRLRNLTNPAGEAVPLTKSELALLIAFLDAPRRTLSREQLLHATRVNEDIFDRSIDVQILRLRRKLEHNASAPEMIVTERGIGYTFMTPVERY